MSDFGGLFHAYFVANQSQICRKLKRNMIEEGKLSYLAAIVFANARRDFAKNNIIPLVDYWNYRSKDYISFFFVGYQGQEDNDSEFVPIIDHENSLAHVTDWRSATSWAMNFGVTRFKLM